MGYKIAAILATNSDFEKFPCYENLKKLPVDIYRVHDFPNWNSWNWREHLLRKLDTVKPGIVIQLDQDEQFDSGIIDEIERFYHSDKLCMMFDYRMITDNDRKVAKYPSLRHCKVFKWKEGLTFHPYAGLALPTQYANTVAEMKNRYWLAETKILHYCFYTPDMEKAKTEYAINKYGML